MTPLKIGIIGAGGIAGAHLPHLAARDDVELFAVADVNQDAAQVLADKWQIAQATGDYKSWLPDVDAVLICVPTWLHSEIAVQTLRAGKTTFCEKPMARTREQGEAILQAQQESGAPLQVGFVRRFDDEWLAWREAVLANKIGRPVVWRDIMSGAGPWHAPWFTQDEKGGGPFLDGCIHNLDFALWTFGSPDWVFAHGRTLRTGNTAIDTGTATIRFQSGDELLLAWSWGLPKDCNGGRIFELFGPQGILRFPNSATDENGQRHFVVTRGAPVRNGELGEAIADETITFPSDALTAGFKAQMDEFIAVARSETRPRADGQAGFDSLNLALAILESARTASKIQIYP
jgi:myo-inositol 2-dehydrogenase/D-chiro-inositol 1-dehydrogenase